MAFDRKKFFVKFADDAREHIANVNRLLLDLEKSPDASGTLGQAFRLMHTIKGSAGVLDIQSVATLAHAMEDCLAVLRDRGGVPSRGLFDALFQALDLLDRMAARIQSGGEIDFDSASVLEVLKIYAQKDAGAKTEQAAAGGKPSGSEAASAPRPAAEVSAAQNMPQESVRLYVRKIDEVIRLMTEIRAAQSRLSLELNPAESFQTATRNYLERLARIEERGEESGGETVAEVLEMTRSFRGEAERFFFESGEMLNVQEVLMNDFRERVLNMRMVPLSLALDPLPRIVRDLAAGCGKSVDLELKGGETELDKEVVEKIGDPLVHMVRNAIDHGIETPDLRVRAGKNASGRIRISVRCEGGNAIIEVSDDGSGIPVEKVRATAIERGILKPGEAGSRSDADVLNLIFLPGFSTRTEVSSLSGRGVGMDAVRENIVDKLKGTIHVESVPGKGARFLLRVPITLAIIRVFVVASGNTHFAFPVHAIEEILRLPAQKIIRAVGRPALRLRDQIIPVLGLSRLFAVPGASANGRHRLVVLLNAGSEKIGVEIERLVGEEDLEVKPLPAHLRKIDVISGVSGHGKDDVVYLLNVPRLTQLAKNGREESPAAKPVLDKGRGKYILVVDDSPTTREIEKEILESCGFKVDLASDGREACEKAVKTAYDLVITDIEMPNMDGYALIRELRSKTAYRETPIIIVSSLDTAESRQIGKSAGASAQIVKGRFEQAAFLDTIREYI